MTQDRHERIRAKAHELWLAEGAPEGRAEEHWQLAEAIVDLADGLPGAGSRLSRYLSGKGPEVSDLVRSAHPELDRLPAPRKA